MLLKAVDWPEFSVLGPEPLLDANVYESRLARLRSDMIAAGLTAIAVYADREHYANVAYLTGFDPRFEEALLLVGRQEPPVLVCGNESLSLVGESPLSLQGVLCQSFSLPGQDRSLQRRLFDALSEAGLSRSARCGVVGWKPISSSEAPAQRLALALPQFIQSELEEYLHDPLEDATTLICGLSGLRASNEADQLALHEHRATRASQSVWRAVEALQPGLTSELDVSRSMQLIGLPLSCHVSCTNGEKSNGLKSPTDQPIQRGNGFSTAVGYWGGLCCREGLVHKVDDAEASVFIERFATPYYTAVQAWYEAITIGTTGGAVSARIHEVLAPHGMGTALDAGHLIHLDEWLDSPFWPGSQELLQSGAALQCDIIPTSSEFPNFVCKAEDSLALADSDLRAELAERYPEMWGRVGARREFMSNVLGLAIADELLPFSDRQGALAPTLLSPSVVFTY